MNAKHTPGPWKVSIPEYQSSPRVDAEGGAIVAGLVSEHGDARLIAAAPDYKDAADLLWRKLKATGGPSDYSAWHKLTAADIGEILSAFRYADRKATGEDHA